MLINVCTGKRCGDRHSKYILARLEREKEVWAFWDRVQIESCTCQGRCDQWPTVLFDKELLVGMNPIKASEQFLKRLGVIKKQISEKRTPKMQEENKDEGFYS